MNYADSEQSAHPKCHPDQTVFFKQCIYAVDRSFYFQHNSEGNRIHILFSEGPTNKNTTKMYLMQAV